MAARGLIQASGETVCVNSEMEKLKKLKKSIYSIKIKQNDGKWTKKGRGFLIQKQSGESLKLFLLISKSSITDPPSSCQIAAYRYRSIWSKITKQKKHHVIKLRDLSTFQQHHSDVIFVEAPNREWYLKYDYETKGNPRFLWAYSFCYGNSVDLCFRFNDSRKTYDPCNITEKKNRFIGAPVMVETNLDLVAGVVDEDKSNLRPLLCKY